MSELTGFPGSNGGVSFRLPGPGLIPTRKAPACAMFTTLSTSRESRNRRRASFIYGLLAEVLLIEAAVYLGVSVTSKLPVFHQHYTVTWMPTAAPPPPPVVAPPREMARVVLPKIEVPETDSTPVAPPPPVTHLDPPKAQPDIPATVRATEPPAPAAIRPQPAPRMEVAVNTGLFGGGAHEPVTTHRPIEQVQTGGFGSPNGLPGHAEGKSSGNVPKLGAFGLPEGPGVGNGTGGAHGVQGVVASAGFGSGVAGPGGAHGVRGVEASAGFGSGEAGRAGGGTAGPVAVGGFAKTIQTQQPQQASAPAAPAEFEPIEILSKPSPIYTEEATKLGIEGEVVLSVVFRASGALRVVGVVHSLGHGLDEAAEAAAARIRFKPAQRAGRPEDFPATLRIQFRLAN